MHMVAVKLVKPDAVLRITKNTLTTILFLNKPSMLLEL